ncbi:MAG TPA: hypothetical protein VF459_09320 [Caulobacteraceae bacterium]
MRLFKVATGLALGAALLGGCVMPYHEENAALRMVRPAAQTRALADYAAPNNDYPTVGGDILKNQNADFKAAPATTVH